ncbi:HD-GYP domain-containing protein [Haloimpatiens sp. FM7315]|uniref:HD-GYP domain-containing protein n=1 Tax=Haloimpatiens sp. FM7315 TaxID=3298609 RepID=UPI0035A3A274
MLDKLLFKFKERKLYHDVIESLVAALEAKDIYTKGHSDRVADMSYEISKKLGIKGVSLEQIHIAAHLHDIGKIGVPDKVLNKKGRLNPHELEYIKMHPRIGFDILSKSRTLKNISKIVLYHHERWDGKGYPEGISGLSIPIGSRIIAVSDAIDAMTSDRPYRKAMDLSSCLRELEVNKALMFDPIIVECVLNRANIVNKFIQNKKINNF